VSDSQQDPSAAADKILTAAKAAFPELWTDEDGKNAEPWKVMHRQESLTLMARALQAIGETDGPVGPAGPGKAHIVSLVMPAEVAMVDRTLAVTSYFDANGQTAYAFSALGEGQMATWLGMSVLLQDWIIRTAGTSYNTNDKEN
jgi:hypothetical protein